jgi:hypothetical protein
MPTTSYNIDRLQSRAEIMDVMALYCHATDRRNWKLMEFVFHEDAKWSLASLQGQTWRESLAVGIKLFERHILATSHQLGNVLMRIDGDVAITEAYCTAYHRVRADAPPGGPFGGVGYEYDLVGGLRYVDRFERRNGTWRIAERHGLSDWRHCQPAADGVLGQVDPLFRGARDGTDRASAVVSSLMQDPPAT